MIFSRAAQWIIAFFVVVGGLVFLNAVLPASEEPSFEVQEIESPVARDFEREQKILSARQNEIKEYLETRATEDVVKKGPQGREGQILENLREALNGPVEAAGEVRIEKELRGLGKLQNYQDLSATEIWTDILLEVAERYPSLDRQTMDIARDFEGPEVLRRFYGLPKLSAASKAHLIEASLYRSELANPDPVLVESASELVRSMLQRGNAAETLSALNLVTQVPGMDDGQLALIEQSLCRFQSQSDLEFTLIRSKWGRVAKRSLSSDGHGPCHGS